MPAFNLTKGAAYVVITAATGSIYTILVWFIRLFIRLKIHPPFAWDDIHCTIATFFTILDSCLVLSQTGYGLGHHANAVEPAMANTQRILGWLHVICFVQASCFSILSVTFLLVRVTKLTRQARPAYLTAFAAGLWCLISTTIILFQCRLPEPWRTRPHSRCIDIYAAWAFITISRSVIEFSNVLIAAWLIWKLHMPVRPKVTIIAMFALRLLVIPPAVTRLRYLKISWQAADWSYARINVQIISQVTLHESGSLHPPTQMHMQDSGRRVSKRRSSISGFRARETLTWDRSELDTGRRTRSEHGLLCVPTAVRPGPVHTLRINSWSAPGSLNQAPTPGESIWLRTLQAISTAEHDPEDAKSASLERRRSVDSTDSRKAIKRTQSFTVNFRESEDKNEGEGGKMKRAKSGRQGSAGSGWSYDEDAAVRENGPEDNR